MPANMLVTLRSSGPTCGVDGGEMQFTVKTIAAPDELGNYVVSYELRNAANETIREDSANVQQKTFQVTGLSDDSYTIVASDQQGNSGENTFTIDCVSEPTVEPLVLAVTATDATVSGGKGTISASLTGGTPPLTIQVPAYGPTPGFSQAVAAGQQVTLEVVPGQWKVVGQDSATPPQIKQQTVTVGSAGNGDPAPVPGACNDPEADNYLSTDNDGVCTFSPKLELDTLPDLVALGRPVPVALHSAAILWAEPLPARASVVLAAEVEEGDTLTVNGYIFTAGPATVPGRFTDAETLADALLSTPALAALYSIEQTATDTLELVARRVGRRYNLTAESSGSSITDVVLTSGEDMYYSERRAEWGVWLEVWAVPGALFGPGQSKEGAVLTGKFEARYRKDNAYEFDIADCLRQFTDLDYDAAGRITGYFLRFGETFADVAGGYRRRKRVGESNVLFGLEAVEIVPPALLVDGNGASLEAGFPYVLPIAFDGSGSGGAGTLAGWRRLSRRPGSLTLPTGAVATVLNPVYGGPLNLGSSMRSATGQETYVGYGDAVPAGVARTIRGEWAGAAVDLERATLSLSGTLLATAKLEGPTGVVLSFVNGQGGLESVSFEGAQEPAGKRTLNQYGTSTGQRTYSAELPYNRRYSTLLLSAEEWAWLRDELGNSPAVWLETETGPEPVNVVDFDASADVVKGDYTLTVEVEFCEQPARGLTN